jgi:lipopolysaccharide transport system permease protein
MMYVDFLNEIYAQRNLLRELILKDLKIRYSRPLLGFFWAFLSPVLTVVVFYLIFSVFLKVRIEETSFLLYLMTAIFPWSFFQNSLMSAATSLVDNKNLIRESNFPHYLIPVAIVLANFIVFLPSLAILIILSLLILKGWTMYVLLLPFVLLIHLLVVTGLSIIFSVLYVRWRDIKFILDSCLMLVFYLIPGVYSIRMVKEVLSPMAFSVYTSNPFVGILDLYRLSILRGFSPMIHGVVSAVTVMVIPAIFAVFVFSLGLYMYKRSRTGINDYLSY